MSTFLSDWEKENLIKLNSFEVLFKLISTKLTFSIKTIELVYRKEKNFSKKQRIIRSLASDIVISILLKEKKKVISINKYSEKRWN